MKTCYRYEVLQHHNLDFAHNYFDENNVTFYLFVYGEDDSLVFVQTEFKPESLLPGGELAMLIDRLNDGEDPTNWECNIRTEHRWYFYDKCLYGEEGDPEIVADNDGIYANRMYYSQYAEMFATREELENTWEKIQEARDLMERVLPEPITLGDEP